MTWELVAKIVVLALVMTFLLEYLIERAKGR